MANAGFNNMRRGNNHARGAPPVGAYRFFKLTGSNSLGGNILTLAEVQIRSVPGTPEVMSAGVATAQSVTGSNVAGLAIDAITGTAWTSGAGASGAGNWWLLEFATPRAFEELWIHPGGSTHFNNCPRTIHVEASADGITYDDLGTWSTGAWVSGTPKTYAVP